MAKAVSREIVVSSAWEAKPALSQVPSWEAGMWRAAAGPRYQAVARSAAGLLPTAGLHSR